MLISPDVFNIAATLILEKKKAGASNERIISQLLDLKIPQEFCSDLIDKVLAERLLAADFIEKKLHKTENLLEKLRLLRQLDGQAGSISEVHEITQDTFNSFYYCMNRAVLLRGIVKTWPAYSLWSLDYLRKYANRTVEIIVQRDSDDQYERNINMHRKNILFGQYLNLLANTSKTNNFYMVASNGCLQNELAELCKDFEEIPGILKKPDASLMNLFLGPAGTVTAWHKDRENILLAQIFGHKLIHLIPSLEIHLMQSDSKVYSEVRNVVDIKNKYSLAANATISRVELHPGDALFLPTGWWHHVESLSVSASVSCFNFHLPNS